MFSLSELVCLNERQSRFELLKPWWEVFMDHLVILMLMVGRRLCAPPTLSCHAHLHSPIISPCQLCPSPLKCTFQCPGPRWCCMTARGS
uniref:LRRC8 pannexin-like TM region domain-containing protein n=1 Tax=Myripristis murdjan TaxID=586833 RepID=A0A668AGT4_9TELE